jgi:L-fuconolactonase
VSGLYPPGGDLTAWTAADLRPVLDTALELFGPDRLMLGSDWPVSVLAGGYARVWGELSRLVDQLSPAERDAVRGGTAVACYGLSGSG